MPIMVRMSEEDPDFEGKWPDLSAPEPAWKLVPIQPDDNMAGKLARDIVMWWSFSPPTGRMLHRHVRALHHDVPQWLADLIPDREVVPPKGAVACAIYRAMLDAAPAAPQMTDAEMDDAIKRDEAEQERAHIAYLRGVDEGKRQAAAPQQVEPVAWMAFGGALVHAVTRNAMDPIEAERFDVPLYLHPPAAPQQAEPVAQIGWADEFGNLFPMGAWKPTQRTHHDSHKTAWRAVYLHPPAEPQQAEPVAWYDPTNKIPRQAVTFSKADRDEWPHIYKEPLYLHPLAAEVQLLRDAVAKLSTIVRVPNAEHIADEHNAAVAFLRRALEGGE